MDLIRDMLGRASELLSEGKTIVEWFNPKDFLHRGAFKIYCNTGAWPEGVVPENVTVTPGSAAAIAQKIHEARPAQEDPDQGLPDWALEAFERAMQGYSGEFEGEFGSAEIIDFVHGQCPDEAEWTPELKQKLILRAKEYGLDESKLNEAMKDFYKDRKLPNWVWDGIRDVVSTRDQNPEEMNLEKALAIVGSRAPNDEWNGESDDSRRLISAVSFELEKYGIMEGKVPAREDNEQKILQKLTEAGIKENEIRDIWIVTRPTGAQSTMEDVVAKSSPRRLMIMARGGLEPEDLVGVYDNDIDARKKGSALLGAGVAEAKVNERPDAAVAEPEAEAGAGLKDPGFDSKAGEGAPGEEEAPVGDLDVDDEHEAVEAEFDKIYLGQDDTTHFYVVAKKGDEGQTEDLLVTDQEGKELFSAKENGIDFNDVGKFILAAINSDKVKIRELEREVVDQYLVPEKEEEIGASEEEQEEGEAGEGEATPPKGDNEEPEMESPDQERPMESRKVTEKKVTETVQVKDGKGNTFSVQIVDEGSKDVVVQVNNREFRFKPDFAALYEQDGGKLTEAGLQDLVTELLSHLREDEYAEVVGSGVQESGASVGSDMTAAHDREIAAEYKKLKKDPKLSDSAIIHLIAGNIGVTGEDVARSLRMQKMIPEGKVPDKDDGDEKIVKKLTEQEYSDMTGLTKEVFKVEFVLDNGEKRQTRVMAFDKNDAKVMLKRQKGVKDVTSAEPVKSARESKVKEGRGEDLYEEAIQLAVDMIAEDHDIDEEVVIKKVMDTYHVDRRMAVDIYNRANDEDHLDTGTVHLGESGK